MATIKRMATIIREEETTDFSSHSGTVYMQKIRSVDGNQEIVHIWVNNPTLANFASFDDGTAVPVGSLLTDLATGKLYIKTDATTWTLVGAQT